MKRTWMLIVLVLVLLVSACATTPTATQPAKVEPTVAATEPAKVEPTLAPTEPAKVEPTAVAKEPLKVCVALYGKLGDQSYNDAAAEGIYRAEKDFGITYKLLEADDAAARDPNLIACASGDYDLTVAVGSAYLDVVKQAAADYPDMKFAITDSILYPTPPNVISVAFAPNEGQFLVGALMAMFTTEADLPGVNEDKVVGWITGTENPNINDFYAGFEHGVHYIDPEITILKGVTGAWGDPIKGKEFANAQYDQGADIIANVAAGTGLGIIETAKERQLFVVGVDINQDNLAPGYVVTSMVKHVGVGVYDVISSVVNGNFDGGGYIYMDLSKKGIELTDFSTFKTFWGDKFPEEIYQKVKELEAKIVTGEIKVNTNPDIRFWDK